MPNDQFEVTATALNLRSRPAVMPDNRVAVLPEGQRVRKVAESEAPGWWRIETDLSGVRVEGFVNSAHLAPAGIAPAPTDGTRAAHLRSSSPVRRDASGSWAFALNEPRQPTRDGTDPAGDLGRIVEWLAVDRSERYRPRGGTTYCNIYAYDYAFLAGAYLPRVWWTSAALRELDGGKSVAARYGATVTELNANALCDWFEQHGGDFGWRRTFDLDELQGAANRGEVGIVVAQRADLNRSGHIVAAVPETPAHRAVRAGGHVDRPLQSQAGSQNFRYGGTKFWTEEKFRKHGFWLHR